MNKLSSEINDLLEKKEIINNQIDDLLQSIADLNEKTNSALSAASTAQNTANAANTAVSNASKSIVDLNTDLAQTNTKLNNLVTNSSTIANTGLAMDAIQNNAAIANTLANRLQTEIDERKAMLNLIPIFTTPTDMKLFTKYDINEGINITDMSLFYIENQNNCSAFFRPIFNTSIELATANIGLINNSTDGIITIDVINISIEYYNRKKGGNIYVVTHNWFMLSDSGIKILDTTNYCGYWRLYGIK